MKKIIILTYFLLFYINRRQTKLHGNLNLGYYYLNIYVGNPPQKQSLILDTGSQQIIFPHTKCKNCNKKHMNNNFNINNSKTFKYINSSNKNWKIDSCTRKKCYFSQGYTEGSNYNGFYGQDYLRFKNEIKEKTNKDYNSIIGIAQNETNLFYDQKANGILGIGVYNKLIKRSLPPTIVETEHKEKRIPNLIFSICYGMNGGYFSLGDNNKEFHLKNSKEIKAKMLHYENSYQYRVKMNYIKVDKFKIKYNYNSMNKNNRKGSFLDSGTTLVYMKQDLRDKVINFIKNYCKINTKKCEKIKDFGNNDLCFNYNKKLYKNISEYFSKFPLIHFNIGNNQNLEWRPNEYLINSQIMGDNYCVGIKVLKNLIMGSLLLKNYDIKFDKLNKMIYFNRSKCSEGYTEYYYNYSNSNNNMHNINSTYYSFKNIIKHTNLLFSNFFNFLIINLRITLFYVFLFVLLISFIIVKRVLYKYKIKKLEKILMDINF